MAPTQVYTKEQAYVCNIALDPLKVSQDQFKEFKVKQKSFYLYAGDKSIVKKILNVLNRKEKMRVSI